MKELWDEFYARAVLAGMHHHGLRDVLFTMIDRENFGAYGQSFGAAMKKLWTQQSSSGA
jgi:hypothetical protein